ncbi:MAG: response regulator, partial [Candidatus Ranarchaeia archaeon]
MKHLILVVDDNRDILYNLKMLLEFNDYEVATARDGDEALKVLESLPRPPDLILSDIMMPRLNGY